MELPGTESDSVINCLVQSGLPFLMMSLSTVFPLLVAASKIETPAFKAMRVQGRKERGKQTVTQTYTAHQ